MGIRFMFLKTVLGKDGHWNPPLDSLKDAKSHEGGFQISICGSPSDFRELARQLEIFGQALEQSTDTDEHKHFDQLVSADGRTAVQVILRRNS